MAFTRVSIIVPFYNVEQFIGRCLDSIYRQNLPENEYEVICVDDCSPDNSLSIVELYAKDHLNLKIVRNQTNRKLGGARNAGLDVAIGDYIWFVDSDDLIEDNVLKELCSIAEENDLDVLHFNYENYPIKTHLHELQSTGVVTGPELFFDKRFIWYHDLVTAWRKLYRRSFLIENHISFAEHIMYEDSDYAIRVFAKAQRVLHNNIQAYNYNVNPASITRVEYTSNHILYWIDLCKRLLMLKTELIKTNADLRFQTTINSFVKYEISHVLKTYKKLQGSEKRSSRLFISKSLTYMRGYMSYRDYLKFILRLI